MLRLTQVALVAVLVACVSSAPQSVFKPPGQESLQPTPDLFLGSIRSEHNAEGASVTQRLRALPKHTIKELATESEGGNQLPVTYTSADENISSKLPDSSWMKSVDGTAQEVGIRTRKNSDNAAKEAYADIGRKLLGVPPDLTETAISAEPKTKQETEIISEIESILSKVKEQYSKKSQPLSAPESEVSSEMHTPQSITDLLKFSASQANDETWQEDSVIEDARQRYMTIWNQEAASLNAPYMKVTKAWPELGVVYMPVVTQVTNQIKASESVKEAGRIFKDVWERRRTEIKSSPTEVEPMLNILNNFMNAWLWMETTKENTNTSEVGEAIDREEQILQKTDVDRPMNEKKLLRHDDSLLRTNVMNGFDVDLDALYKNIFHPKRIQPNLEPSSDSEVTNPFATLGNNKIMLSCSVVPGEGSGHTDTNPVPVSDHRPIKNHIGVISSIIDPSRAGNPIRENPNPSIQHVGQQTEDQKLIINPVAVTRPAPDSAAGIRPVKNLIAVNRPVNRPLVSPIAYSRPLVWHGVVTRPIARTDGFPPVIRHSFKEGRVDEDEDPRESEEDTSHSSEFDEQFIRRHAPHHV